MTFSVRGGASGSGRPYFYQEVMTVEKQKTGFVEHEPLPVK